METFQRIIGGRQKIPVEGFLNFTPLSFSQQRYLTNVYALLATTIISTLIGLYISTTFFSIPLLLAAIGQFACVMYIGATTSPQGLKGPSGRKRAAALLTCSFLLGSSLSQIVAYANFLNPSILPTALLATLAVFCSFSLAAMFSKERQFLFLGSILASGLTYLSFISFFNLFFHSNMAHNILLYGGLFLYMGFVLYDTQAILYEHSRGQTDVILHALVFYVDVIGIFLRLLRILLEKEERQQRNEERRKR